MERVENKQADQVKDLPDVPSSLEQSLMSSPPLGPVGVVSDDPAPHMNGAK